MSVLRDLEIGLLLKAAANPKPRRSATERKRDQRQRVAAAKAASRPILNAETMSLTGCLGAHPSRR
nr:F34 [uncultured bacterium]